MDKIPYKEDGTLVSTHWMYQRARESVPNESNFLFTQKHAYEHFSRRLFVYFWCWAGNFPFKREMIIERNGILWGVRHKFHTWEGE